MSKAVAIKKPNRPRVTPPPCAACDQRVKHCDGVQIKRAAKACQLLMSHIVGKGIDGQIAYDVAVVLKPSWFRNERNSSERHHQISTRVFNDLQTAERRCLRETRGNSTWNRERKYNV